MEALRSLEIGIRAIRAQRQAMHVIGHNEELRWRQSIG